MIDGVPYWDGGVPRQPRRSFRCSTTPAPGRADRPDQPAAAHRACRDGPRDRQSRQRDQLQLLARLGIPHWKFVARLIDRGHLQRGIGPGKYRRINAHRIVLGEDQDPSADPKLSTDYDFFRMLHAGGRRAAQRFLDEHFDDIGRREHLRPARRGPGGVGMMAKAITTIATATTGTARLEIVAADITALGLDAIVNAANSSRCSAAAGSTARSTAPRVRTSSRTPHSRRCATGAAKITRRLPPAGAPRDLHGRAGVARRRPR